jgi:hypothetical protein
MIRLRIWVGGLHGGQLLLLVLSLLLIGVIVGVGSIDYAEDMQGIASVKFSDAASVLALARIDSINRARDGRVMTIGPNLVERAFRTAAEKKRARANAAWVLRTGVLGWATVWFIAFLSLWWWFGARAKGREHT